VFHVTTLSVAKIMQGRRCSKEGAWSICGITDKGQAKHSEKSCSIATLPTTDLKCTGQRWNPTLCSKKPVTNSLK